MTTCLFTCQCCRLQHTCRILKTESGKEREGSNVSLASVMDENACPENQPTFISSTIARPCRSSNSGPCQFSPPGPPEGARLALSSGVVCYLTYNCRTHRSLNGKCQTREVYLRRPDSSVFVESRLVCTNSVSWQQGEVLRIVRFTISSMHTLVHQ